MSPSARCGSARHASRGEPTERREAVRRRVKNLHGGVRALYDALGQSGTFFLSGVRMGGYHGYDEGGATDVVGGGVAGYTKALARESPTSNSKSILVLSLKR